MTAGREQPPPTEAAPGDAGAPSLITPMLLRGWPLPEPTGTKYSRGQVLVVGGARRTPGAAMLAGLAALRMGAGRLSLAVAESAAPHVAVAVPECGAYGLAESFSGSITGEDIGRLLEPEVVRADALLIGPGLDDVDGAIRVLEEILEIVPDDLPLVLDAYGATVLPDLESRHLARLAGRIAMTPNTTELARLVGEEDLDVDDIPHAAQQVVQRYGASVSCTGWVVTAAGVWQVATGDTGLGTSGSGDVLAGAVAGLLSRGASRDQALVWGAYTHAAAGDVLATKFGRVGYIAGELLPELPLVLGSLRGD
jgi:ADP-dependent NAD(P)H-hydrate dehydratase